MLYRITLLLLFLLFHSVAWSQTASDQQVLNGQIRDDLTKEPLAFATVSLLNTSKGVVSNFLGEFTFKHSKWSEEDTLLISMMGYTQLMLPFRELDDQSYLTIELAPSVVLLQGIEVKYKTLTGKEIIQKAIDHIPDNYPSSPFLLEFFTRSYKKECDEYKHLYEATFSFHANSLTRKSNWTVYLNETRQSQRVNYYHAQSLRPARNLVQLLISDDTVFPAHRSLLLRHNDYKIDSYTMIDDRLVYVIEGNVVRGNHFEFDRYHLYIDTESYAVLKIDTEVKLGSSTWTDGRSSDSTWHRAIGYQRTLQFAKQNGKYYPKYSMAVFRGKVYKDGTNEVFCEDEFHTEMIVDDIKIEDVKRPSSKKMDRKKPHEYQLQPYNASFWENYGMINDFPVNEQIVKDLSKHGDLETQFMESYEDMEVHKKTLKK
ncbi:MAG: carboxypeptidase-like regulatory domain-containing protein [Cyclobacteriaceae bacterium]